MENDLRGHLQIASASGVCAVNYGKVSGRLLLPDYEGINDREARHLATAVAERCRTVGRPVTGREVTASKGSTKVDYNLLRRAVALGYLSAWPVGCTTLYMPVQWGFGPQKGGCCK